MAFDKYNPDRFKSREERHLAIFGDQGDITAKYIVIVGDDYGHEYYGPFDGIGKVELWLEQTFGRGVVINERAGQLRGDRWDIIWEADAEFRLFDGERASISIRRLERDMQGMIVRDGH